MFGRRFHSPSVTVRFIVTWSIGRLILSSFWVTSFIRALPKILKSIFILFSKIWWMSFFFPLHFPVLSSFNPPDGPLSTPSTVSFGLQSCPYTGGFKTCLKVCVKGLLRERSNCKAIVLLSVFGMILVYFEIVCTLTPTAVFIATFNWLGWTIYAARHITWTDEDLECARLKQTCTAVSQHNSALPEASRYCSSDLDLCSSGKNVTPDGESKSFAIPSLGISCLHFLSFSFLKTLFLILFPQQPCLFVSNILEVPFSSSWGNGMSLSVLTV